MTTMTRFLLSAGAALAQSERRRAQAADWGSRCTGIVWPSTHPMALPWEWRLRTLSWRLAPESHAHPDDSRRAIWNGLNASLSRWPGYTWVERCAQRLWVGVMLLAPRALVARLAWSNVSGDLRARLRRALLASVRRRVWRAAFFADLVLAIGKS